MGAVPPAPTFVADAPIMQQTLLFWASSLTILAGGAWLVCPQGQCAATAIDLAGLALAHDLRSARLDHWMQALTWLGSLAVLLPVSALAALLLWRGRHRRAAEFLMLALLVGLSRIYLQVHFPSDVLAGTLAAALWVDCTP